MNSKSYTSEKEFFETSLNILKKNKNRAFTMAELIEEVEKIFPLARADFTPHASTGESRYKQLLRNGVSHHSFETYRNHSGGVRIDKIQNKAHRSKWQYSFDPSLALETKEYECSFKPVTKKKAKKDKKTIKGANGNTYHLHNCTVYINETISK